MAALPELDREVLTLRLWDDLEIAEIAGTLGIASGAVRVRLHRAKRRLALALRGTSAEPRAARQPAAALTPALSSVMSCGRSRNVPRAMPTEGEL